MTTVSNDNIDFERLVAEYKSTIYSVCCMFADDKMQADDLFQEVLINLWTGFAKFRGESSRRTWVYRVSMNTCISYRRKKKVNTEPIDNSHDLIDDTPADSRQVNMLRQRIMKLEPIDKAIVLLWLENLAYEEIAAIVGTSVRNISVRLVRIKEKLKKL